MSHGGTLTLSRLHHNELPIDAALVRRLLDGQFPEYQQLPLKPLPASGSSNRLFQLGNGLLVRLPRQPGGSAGIEKEQQRVAQIRSALPVASPQVVVLGEPAFGYPERWSIVQWLAGDVVTAYKPESITTHGRTGLARDLASVITALQAISIPTEASLDSSLRGYRGDSLAAFDPNARKTIQFCRTIPDLHINMDQVLAIWEHSLKLPGASIVMADHWYHGDLVAENLLTQQNRLTAVLDFGGLSIGDPTVELHGAWELFDPDAREVFRRAVDVDDAQWLRGRAWALMIALGALSYYWGKMPRRQHDRLAMANAVIADVKEHHPTWLRQIPS